MNNDWDALMGAVVRGLREQVVPHVGDAQALVQLHAAIYVLDNLRKQGGWSPALLLRQVEAQQVLFAALREALPGASLPLPESMQAPLRNIEQLRDEGDIAVNTVTDMLNALPAGQRGPAHARAGAAVSAYLRAVVAIDRGATAKSMMLELSGPGSQLLD